MTSFNVVNGLFILNLTVTPSRVLMRLHRGYHVVNTFEAVKLIIISVCSKGFQKRGHTSKVDLRQPERRTFLC